MCAICEIAGPPRRVHQTTVLPVLAMLLPELRPSRHRSARLTKKLHRRGAQPLYGRPRVMLFGAAARQKLEELT